MSLTVIIPVKDRAEVGQCVESLLLCDRVTNVVICDGGSSDEECVRVLQNLCWQDRVQLKYLPMLGFNKARLINRGIVEAIADFVLISDADIIWNAKAVNSLLRHISADADSICYVQDVRESQPSSIALKRDRYTYDIQVNSNFAMVKIVLAEEPKNSLRPGCGLICARKSTLLKLGGYKEIFRGWGWEDQDLLMRAALLEMGICSDGRVIHLSHEDAQRNRYHSQAEPGQTRNHNILTCLRSLHEGNVWGSLLDEISAPLYPKPIHIKMPKSFAALAN